MALLAARSPYLRVRLKQAMQEQVCVRVCVCSTVHILYTVVTGETNMLQLFNYLFMWQQAEGVTRKVEVQLTDTSPEAFQLLLLYVYTDEIMPLKTGEEANSVDVINKMMDVYRLAIQVCCCRLIGRWFKRCGLIGSLSRTRILIGQAC